MYFRVANSAPLRSLTLVLSTPLVLGLPDRDKPFHLHWPWNDGITAGILGQPFASVKSYSVFLMSVRLYGTRYAPLMYVAMLTTKPVL